MLYLFAEEVYVINIILVVFIAGCAVMAVRSVLRARKKALRTGNPNCLGCPGCGSTCGCEKK